MKNIFKYVMVLALAVGLTGCEADLITYSNTNFIQLKDASDLAITENGGDVVEIVVQLGGPRDTDTPVSWVVQGDPTRFVVSPPGGEVVIPAGDTEASVFFSAVDDDDINGDVTINLGLADSGVPVGLGGEGVNSASKSITIVDDNVPCNNYVLTIEADRWGDEVMWDIIDSEGNVVIAGGPYPTLPPDGVTADEVSVTLDDGCYTFRQFDYYGDSWGGGGVTAVCGSLTSVDAGGTDFPGIDGLDISTVPVNPNYGVPFRGSSSTSGAPPYVAHAQATDFCVNQ